MATLAAAVLAIAPSYGQEAEVPLRFARVSADGAEVRNLADTNGVTVAEADRGTLVAVYREVAGWLEVEVPQGFAVWVFGRYLQPTSDAGVFEVTRNAVNIRPLPKSDVTSFPLPQRLHAGDRVQVVEPPDAAAALEESWVHVWSPPGVHAWMRADQTEDLAAGEDGAALWAAADRPRPRPALPGVGTTEAAASAVPAAKAAQVADQREQLGALTATMEAESRSDAPNYSMVRPELEALAAAAQGELAIEAQSALARLTMLEEVAALRVQLAEERERRLAEAQGRRVEVREASRAKDPLGDVFLARGALIRTLAADGMPRYHVRFGKDVACEVLCSGGRYDLDLFSGFEVGVFGSRLGDSAAPSGASVPVIDVRRMEILARR